MSTYHRRRWAARARRGGIFATAGQVSLYRSAVATNAATQQPGGLFADKVRVRIDDETDVIHNDPANCAGSTLPVAHCFR